MSADIHALSGAYAVDALSDEERLEFEAHLATCAACRDEVDSLRAAASVLGESVPATPPASVRDAVLAGIQGVRPLPPVVPQVTDRPRPGRPRWLVGLVAAAAAVAVLGAGTVVWHPWRESTTQVSLADQVIASPDARSFTARVHGAQVTLVRSESLGRAVLTSPELPQPPAGRVYELWLQAPSGHMAPAGLLPSGGSQKFLLSGDARTAIGAGITVEPAGGSDQPTTVPVALFGFGAAT